MAGLNADIKADIASDIEADINADIKAKPKTTVIDKVMYCLEKEDTITEQLVGYGVCALAAFYLLGSLLRAVLQMVA